MQYLVRTSGAAGIAAATAGAAAAGSGSSSTSVSSPESIFDSCLTGTVPTRAQKGDREDTSGRRKLGSKEWNEIMK